jgi:hypothetical protein
MSLNQDNKSKEGRKEDIQKVDLRAKAAPPRHARAQEAGVPNTCAPPERKFTVHS